MSFGIDFFNIYHSIDTGCASLYLEDTEAGAKSSMPEKTPLYDLTLWIKTIPFFFFFFFLKNYLIPVFSVYG